MVSGLNHVVHDAFDGDGETDLPTSNKLTYEEIERGKNIMRKETQEQDNNYNFFYRDKDKFLRFGAEHIDDGGVEGNTIVINAHASAKHISSPTGPLYPATLHDYLYKSNVLYKDSYNNDKKITIKIMACNTGNGFAKKFSTYNPNVTVIAPNDYVHNFAGINYMKTGSYLKFNKIK